MPWRYRRLLSHSRAIRLALPGLCPIVPWLRAIGRASRRAHAAFLGSGASVGSRAVDVALRVTQDPQHFTESRWLGQEHGLHPCVVMRQLSLALAWRA